MLARRFDPRVDSPPESEVVDLAVCLCMPSVFTLESHSETRAQLASGAQDSVFASDLLVEG